MQANASLQVAAIVRPDWSQPPTKDQLLQRWLDARKALDDAKSVEASLRSSVVDAFPFDEDNAEGTQRIEIGNGYQLKVVKKLNYKLLNDDGQTDRALDKIEALSERAKLHAERLVKWSPTLSVSEYRELPADVRGIIDDVLTITPGLPTLELVEPKAKK